MTKLQLAQKRNWFKFVLSGLNKPVDTKIMTGEERDQWRRLMDIRNDLLDDFDRNSRHLGLNVPEYRCWCGKEGKYNHPDHPSLKVCYKHRT